MSYPVFLFVLSFVLPQALAGSVCLADFAPYATDLSSACQTLYEQSIVGCSSSDFTSGACSTTCVNALNEMAASISTACVGVTGSNIIAAMLDNKGTADLCPSTTAGGQMTTMVSTTGDSAAAAVQTADADSEATFSTSDVTTSTATATTTSSIILYNSGSVQSVATSASSVSTVIFATNTPQSVIDASKTHSSSAAASTTSVNEGGTLLGSSQSSGASAVAVTKGAAGVLLAACAGAALLL